MKHICVKILSGADAQVQTQFKEAFFTQASLLQADKGYSFSYVEEAGVHYDYHLFIKDSMILRAGALAQFLDCAEHLPPIYLLVGSVAGPDGKWSGGGLDGRFRPVYPKDMIPFACETFSSSLLLLPSAVSDHIGFRDQIPPSRFTDLPPEVNYGLYARDAGYDSVVAPSFLADTKFPSASFVNRSFWETAADVFLAKIRAFLSRQRQ